MTLMFINPFTMGSMWYMPMILCVYLLIPLLSFGLKKIDNRFFAIPIAIVTFSSFVLPDVNGFLGAMGFEKTVESALDTSNVFSMFVVYLLFGYFIGETEILKRLKTKYIVTLAIISFMAFNLFQFWFYTREYDFVVAEEYKSILLLIASVFAFETIRRVKIGERAKKVTLEISKISFGIYFVHICIMEGLNAAINSIGWNVTYIFRFSILELISFGGSLLLIQLIRKNEWISKNLLGIK